MAPPNLFGHLGPSDMRSECSLTINWTIVPVEAVPCSQKPFAVNKCGSTAMRALEQ